MVGCHSPGGKSVSSMVHCRFSSSLVLLAMPCFVGHGTCFIPSTSSLSHTYCTASSHFYCLTSTCLVLTKGAITSILALIHGPIAMINDVMAME
jgi:hypothetical protein